MKEEELHFSPSLCVTHDCNLSCVYCYQKHAAGEKMSFETAKKSIDWIFGHVPPDMDGVEIDFIGGEPLLEFELIKKIVAYVCGKDTGIPYLFFATTNGTLLTDEMKAWFAERKDCFYLGLSLDGAKETHDRNRSNSFDSIDIDFFRENYLEQGVKMTLSEFSLHHLADDIKYIHSLGFSIEGVNLFEGNFDWDKDEYIELLVPQLKELVRFYVENDKLPPNQMLDKRINFCEAKDKARQKWCGIGVSAPFFDVDGKMYPCSFITPMTFPQTEIGAIAATDFSNDENFIDEECFNNCYIYPICPTCAGANYMANKSFKARNKSKCRIQKLIALFAADLQAKRLVKNPASLSGADLFYTIEAIKKIRGLYADELG